MTAFFHGVKLSSLKEKQGGAQKNAGFLPTTDEILMASNDSQFNT